MALLCAARLLVATIRFGRWRSWLGQPVAAATGGAGRADRHQARVVARALGHLPRGFKCLPQAMALHWMLRRRNRPSQIVIAALPANARIGHDDLHAWTELGGDILIGATGQAHCPVLRLG